MIKAVLIRISTQEIIKKALYPRIDVEPIVGLDADLKWLIVNEIAKPIYDVATQKLVRVEEITIEAHPVYTDFHQYKIYYNIVALTQAEQNAYTQQQEDNDASSTKLQQYKADGQVAFDRAYALIQRKFDNNVITANQAKTLADGIYNALEPLYKGLWQLTKTRYDALTPPVNANLLQIFNTIKTGIDNYITNNL